MDSAKSVLVIDDEENIRELICLTLTDEGYKVLTAPNGAAALTLLKHATPRLILLDMRMPIMDGWEFSKIYYKTARQIAPIIVLTAATDAAKFASQINADAFLPKPFDLEDLLNLVERYTRLNSVNSASIEV